MSYTTSDSNRRTQAKEELRQKSFNSESTNRRQSGLPVVFDERKALVGKWFDKWSTSQRLAVIEDLVQLCRRHQLQRISDVMSQCKLAPVRDDFAYCLPRSLSLRIFTYLDPRSLCRCAQVSWQWKSLVDNDELWVVLCQRLGWTLSHSMSPFDKSAWKRLYIEHIVALRRTMAPLGIERLAVSDCRPSSARRRNVKSEAVTMTDQRPPWKGSDPTPRDIWRHNYLENEDDTDKMINVRRRSIDEKRLRQQRKYHHQQQQQQHPQMSTLISSDYRTTMH